jgi:hypothetical protein
MTAYENSDRHPTSVGLKTPPSEQPRPRITRPLFFPASSAQVFLYETNTKHPVMGWRASSRSCAMFIDFYPIPGMVLICDFRGAIAPEICKTRPVVIISARSARRVELATVVPLSTSKPQVVRSYHFLLRNHHSPLHAGKSGRNATWLPLSHTAD